MQKNSVEIYSAEQQPIKDKIALSLLVSLFCSFNLMIFAPFDFYLSNLGSFFIPLKSMLKAFIPAAVILFSLVFVISVITKSKYHIAAISLFFGSSLALYVQGSFLSVGLGELDGTLYRPGAVKIIANAIIWIAIVASPLLIYKFKRSFFKNFLAYFSTVVFLIEFTTLCVTLISSLFNNDDLLNKLFNKFEAYTVSTQNQFTYSSNKNYIIILTDEYASTCFDTAVEKEPDCVSGFDGFTYYTDTMGMYSYTADAVPFILTGEYNKNLTYDNLLLFDAIKENYKMDIYSTPTMFTPNVYLNYADNYIKKEVTDKDYIQIYLAFSKVTMYRCVPDAFKSMFWIYSDDFFYYLSDMSSYSDDDLDFYNNLEKTLDITEENCFKFIYLFGIHAPLSVSPDLQRVSDGSLGYEDQAIALNKILSEYFDILKENGVYDNSDIVLLADHGLKSYDSVKSPLLMIKRAGETGEGITVSNAQISHVDIYPTLLYLAGYDTEEDTVFDIPEDAERERYFDATGEYITGKIK